MRHSGRKQQISIQVLCLKRNYAVPPISTKVHLGHALLIASLSLALPSPR